MKDMLKTYLESLVHDPKIVNYKIGSCEADQIYCIEFYSNPTFYSVRFCKDPSIPVTSILVSSWDNEEEWKFKIRDAYMESIALVTGDTQILRDRYKEDCGDWDDFD